jgi:hypothetical protein
MDPTIVSLISVGIGAFVTLLGVFLSNWFLMRNAREQWDREHKSEQEKWLRDKLQEIYSNCIYYLGNTPYINLRHDILPTNVEYGIRDTSALESEKLKVEYERLKLGIQQLELDISKYNIVFENEKRRWLNLLAVYHPFRGSLDFNDFLTKMRGNKLTVVDITELSARDPRLHSELVKVSK